jgi:hypothetical protein
MDTHYSNQVTRGQPVDECNGDVTPVRLAVVIVCCKLGAATLANGPIPEHGRRTSPSYQKEPRFVSLMMNTPR